MKHLVEFVASNRGRGGAVRTFCAEALCAVHGYYAGPRPDYEWPMRVILNKATYDNMAARMDFYESDLNIGIKLYAKWCEENNKL